MSRRKRELVDIKNQIMNDQERRTAKEEKVLLQIYKSEMDEHEETARLQARSLFFSQRRQDVEKHSKLARFNAEIATLFNKPTVD